MAEVLAGALHVLLVEDDPGDALMTTEALEDHDVPVALDVVSNGEDAIAYLRREGSFAGAGAPDLVLLDLNLPRRDGREVLRDVKSDPALRRIPVVILTTSDAAQDITQAYDLHANAYVRKPADFNDFLSAVRAVVDFYARRALLPGRA
ncbi:MAG TPA: response regulator [Mycobacteriales bacterium]|nr:response regulator [Mycobacteriales bacterium]